MNRAERRSLKRHVAKVIKRGGTGLSHPAPDSVTLLGGPMDGWVVKPDAPALGEQFYPGLVEARAAGIYNASLSPRGETFAPPSGERKWADLAEHEREPCRDQARREIQPGRYVLAEGGKQARWEAL